MPKAADSLGSRDSATLDDSGPLEDDWGLCLSGGGYLPPSPTVAASEDALSRLPSAAGSSSATDAVSSASGGESRRDLGCNGSFLVIRQLRQDVEGFRKFTQRMAVELTKEPRPPGALPGANVEQMEEWIAAKMVGRWRDGSSLVRNPTRPASGWPGANGSSDERPVVPDNTFRYGAEDPLGHRCPFGAHVRRTNPRDSMHSGEEREISIVNRHRILRVGRPYVPPSEDSVEGRGLLFMCLNADIERQFEFVQQTWCMARQFHGLDGEVDSVIGRGNKGGRLTIPAPEGPLVLEGIQDYVDVLGGAYFFLPSRRALRFLSCSADLPSPAMAEVRTPVVNRNRT